VPRICLIQYSELIVHVATVVSSLRLFWILVVRLPAEFVLSAQLHIDALAHAEVCFPL